MEYQPTESFSMSYMSRKVIFPSGARYQLLWNSVYVEYQLLSDDLTFLHTHSKARDISVQVNHCIKAYYSLQLNDELYPKRVICVSTIVRMHCFHFLCYYTCINKWKYLSIDFAEISNCSNSEIYWLISILRTLDSNSTYQCTRLLILNFQVDASIWF